jgi:actin-related protein 8
MEEARLQVSHTLQSCLQSDGRRRYATPPQQIAAFNRRSSPEVINSSGGEWVKSDGDVVVGDEVRNLTYRVALDDVVVSMLAIVPKICGFKRN